MMASRAQPMLWRDTMKAGARRSGALIGAIALSVLGLNLLGDGLRDVLDPRLRIQQ